MHCILFLSFVSTLLTHILFSSIIVLHHVHRVLLNQFVFSSFYVQTVFVYEMAMCSGELALQNKHYFYNLLSPSSPSQSSSLLLFFVLLLQQ